MDEEKLQDVADELAEAADQAKAAADATGEPATAPQTDAELREALKQADDRALRAQAELENFRKRMRRDMEEERRYAALPLVSDLLAVADNLQRAIESTDSTEETAGLIDGVKMVAAQLETVPDPASLQTDRGIGPTL